MATEFDKHATRGNEILNKLASELNVSPDKALRILRAVLHAVRKHFNIEESMQLLSQLPMSLKGLYADQWNPRQEIHRLHHIDEFLDEVRSYDLQLAAFDFGNNTSAGKIVQSVFRVISEYTTHGEFQDMLASFPQEIKSFVQESLAQPHGK
jgi:uncharacterized protein (DUF2267 family)